MKHREELEKIIQKYGPQNQIDVAIEEMSELTKALIKYRRAKDSGDSADELGKRRGEIEEEIADVQIMLNQLQIIYRNEGPVEAWVDYKVERQMQRISEMEV